MGAMLMARKRGRVDDEAYFSKSLELESTSCYRG